MKEIPEITGMRGFASVGVMVFHLFTISSILRGMGFTPLIYAWSSGVDFFFVLSGFLLSIPFVAPYAKISLRVFYAKRIFRIFPVYYISLLICGTILVITSYGTLQQLVSSLFFAQSFTPATFDSINGVNWTLVIEEIFYTTLPVFSLFFVRKRWIISLPVCLLFSIAYRVTAVEISSPALLAFHLWQYPSYLGHYAIGATLANFFSSASQSRFVPKQLNSSVPALLSILSLLVTQYLVGSLYSIGNNKEALVGMIFAFEYGAMIYSLLASPRGSVLRRIFTNRAAMFTGRISYSLYTWHLPIEFALYEIGTPLFLWVPASLALSIYVAFISFKNLETPFLRLRDRILKEKGWKEDLRHIGAHA